MSGRASLLPVLRIPAAAKTGPGQLAGDFRPGVEAGVASAQLGVA